MARRPPFDDIELREEFRKRLNQIPGVDLPAAKIEMRPSFPLALLADPQAYEQFTGALDWFYQKATRQEAEPDLAY